MHGTRYYPSPDCCLGFFGRLLRSSTDEAHLQLTIGPLLKSRVQERVGESGNTLDLAMRVLACDSLGVECSVDRHTLLRLQGQDGGWESGWMYRYGSTGVKIGNRGVTTALAVKAIASSVSVSKAAAAEKGHAYDTRRDGSRETECDILASRCQGICQMVFPVISLAALLLAVRAAKVLLNDIYCFFPNNGDLFMVMLSFYDWR